MHTLNIASALIAGFCISIAWHSKTKLDECRFNYSIEKLHLLEKKTDALANSGSTGNSNRPFNDVDKVLSPIVREPDESTAQKRVMGQ